MAGTVQSLYTYDQPQDYFRDYAKRVMAMQAADVLARGRRHLDLARFRTVLAGDAGQILPQLAEKNLGPAARFSPDGERIE